MPRQHNQSTSRGRESPRSVLGLAALLFSLMMVIAPASAGEPVLVKTTSWTHSYPSANRGLAYDGTYYYLAHIYHDVPRIDVYDDDGLVKSIPKPAGADYLWPHGVAVDGQQKKIWSTDYFGRTIFEMDFATGAVLRTIISPVANPSRLDYDPATETLWMTGYGDSRVYNVSLQGRILYSFDAPGYLPNKGIALGGSNDILVASGQLAASPLPLRRYALSGALLEEFPRFGNQWDIATNVNDRGAGFLRPNPSEGDPSASYRIEHYSFGQVFKTVRVHDLQLSFTPAPSGKTSGATPEGRGSNPSGAFERLRVYALFKLSDGSDGIDPAAERVSIGIGDWQATLPAGSFVARADGSYAFSGAVGGARAFITISARHDGSYAAFVRMKRPVPARFDNPVQFNLVIGDDHGTTTETVLGTLVTGGDRTPAAE